MTDTISPYLLDEPPTSTGKALLSRALSHWCALHAGLNPDEIVKALESPEIVDRQTRIAVANAARLIGELFAAGEMRTFARPFGGGSPEPLPAAAWELDDFRRRMARSALDPKAPFAPEADPTHWIFVDLEDFNRVVENSCADVMPTARAAPASAAGTVGAVPVTNPPPSPEDRHVRMPELERRTGMSRSTIYRRIEAGRFRPAYRSS